MEPNDPHFDISALLAKLLKGSLTAAEKAQLEEWKQRSSANEQLYRQLTDPAWLAAQLQHWQDEEQAAVWKRLNENRRAFRPLRKLKRWRPGYAAAVLMLLAGTGWGLYRLLHTGENKAAGERIYTNVADARNDSLYMPAGKQAQLVMGNGSVVQLGSRAQQELEEADGTRVTNNGNALQYNNTGESRQQVVYNTVLTPRGGEYALVLADGTKVWLNAASSLRFPVRFTGKERKVILTGEAFFEVAADAQHPFMITTGRSDITVLGTAFNVNAYADEPAEKTALAGGALQVAVAGQAPVRLKPGYQAVVTRAAKALKVEKADLEEALAWRNGLFVFNGASLENIMQRIARWYDVDITYEAGVDRSSHFAGRIRRYENIAGILELLEMTGKVKFMLQGRTLVVKPGIV